MKRTKAITPASLADINQRLASLEAAILRVLSWPYLMAGITVGLESAGEMHKHPWCQIERSGNNIRVSFCSTHGTSVEGSNPKAGVQLNATISADGSQIAFGDKRPSSAEQGRVFTWLQEELDWAIDNIAKLEIARVVLLEEEIWVRGDAITNMAGIAEIGCDEAAGLIDAAYHNVALSLTEDEIMRACGFLDTYSGTRKMGLWTTTSAVNFLVENGIGSPAKAWAALCGVQRAAGEKLDLRVSPHKQSI